MNRHYLTLVLLLTGTANCVLAQVAPPSSTLPSRDEIVRLRALEPEKAKKAEQALLNSRARLGLDFDDTFQHYTSLTDRYGIYHGRFRQLYKGVRVGGTTAIAHLDRADQSRPTTHKLYGGIAIDVNPKISQAQASTIALKAFDPRGTFPQKDAVQSELVIIPDLIKVPNPIDVSGVPGKDALGRPYMEKARSFQLAWSLTVVSDDAVGYPVDYLIDAQTGRILRSDKGGSDVEHAVGKGNSWFHGNVDINTSKKSSSEFFMVDRLRGSDGGNIIRNGKHWNKESDAWFDKYYDSSNTWGNGAKYEEGEGTTTAQGQTAAVDVAWNFERTWDMLKHAFDRNGLNGSGRYLDAAVHYGSPYNDAKYIYYYKRAYFGEGQVSTSLWATAHELGHGLYDHVVGTPKNEGRIAKGINEGHGDITGSLAEFYAFGVAQGKGSQLIDTEADWIWDSRMINPLGYTNSGLVGLRYHPSDFNADHDEEHVIGCLYGHMFIFLAHGAPRGASSDVEAEEKLSPLYSRFLPEGMSGIGVQGAADIWYQATTAHLVADPDFYDLKNAYWQAVNDMNDAPYWWKTAVQAAFHGIGIPSLPIVKDKEAPSNTSVKVDQINQSEGFLLAHAEGRDNILLSRVEFYVDGKLAFTDYRLPYGGPVDISALTPGQHNLQARFFDINGNSQNTNASFTVAGAIQLAINGGFENGTVGWNANDAVKIWRGASPFAGAQYARLLAGAQLWQEIVIPPTAATAKLTYRVRVERHVDGGHLGEFLRVQVRDTKAANFTTVGQYSSNANTASGVFWRNYVPGEVDLSNYRGKTVRILFDNPAPVGNDRFKLDHVRLVVSEEKKIVGTAKVNSAEKTVEFALTVLTGVPANQIKRVEYIVGEKIGWADTGLPFRVLMNVQHLAPGQHTVTARVVNHAEQTIIQASSTFKIEAVKELLVNGNFEAGVSPWFGPGLFRIDEPLLDAPNPSFSGQRHLLLGGEGYLHTSAVRQKVTLPQNAKSAKLTFRLLAYTQEAPGVVADFLSVKLLKDGPDVVLHTFNNTLNTNGPSSWKSYIPVEIDVPTTGLQGKSVYVDFEVKENTGGKRTYFRIDNVSLAVETDSEDIKTK